MRIFWKNIYPWKQELDNESRRHNDTVLPGDKSILTSNYKDLGNNGVQRKSTILFGFKAGVNILAKILKKCGIFWAEYIYKQATVTIFTLTCLCVCHKVDIDLLND